jgi:hydroxyethylthiazole kinase-like uncharacterized protein yjeF
MDRAAAGLASAIIDFLGRVYGRRIVLLVGSGDNGGDALYAGARLARRGASVVALLLSPDRVHVGGIAALVEAGGRTVLDIDECPEPDCVDVVVDGIVGIGASGPLRPDAAAAVERFRGTPFVAVDVPSGVDVDTGEIAGPHVRAAVTVTFGTHKVAHLVDPAASACGVVHLVDIGLELPGADVEALQPLDVSALIPQPRPDAHKYLRGVVGVRAGSATYPGAAVLAVAGACSGFAGMVRYDGVATDLVHGAFPETVAATGRVQAWVVGPGGGADAPGVLASTLKERVSVVVDADALGGVTGPLGVPAVLTPHAGELAAMLGVKRAEVEARQLHHARWAAARFTAVVLLKGRHTLIASPDGAVRVTTVGTPWLATAGAGDVLAGLCGALLAAGLSPFDAASVGSWLHGAASKRAGGRGPLRALDVADALPLVTRELLELTRSV